MPAACLPATGLEPTHLVLLAIVAAVLLVGGVVAMRSTKARAGLVLLPMLLLALVFAGTPTSAAQAVTAKVPDATVSTAWAVGGGTISSLIPPAAVLDSIEEASALSEDAGNIPVYATTVSRPDGTSPTVIMPQPAGFNPANGQVTMSEISVVGTILFAFPPGLSGAYPLTTTITFNYEDDCGKPLQTVFTWTGVYNLQPPQV
jgi:hypothetical protein